ncbi:MAG: methylenetetrahydrofolate reductase (NADPH) [Candidatus Tokpelaia sp. JSC161]|jgi:methylenetetrahydrofolate reductase (NADPH)|nr:MAG: methylenetetrahydrofolate reductase (NADPH) [Candidatus Tokpelaia sp. JSC161]
MSEGDENLSEKIHVSFEFFPPRTEQMEEKLWKTVHRLSPLNPHFVSVTYGAGGSTRERTFRTVARLLKETDLVTAAHLTCVNATRAKVNKVACQFSQLGIRRFVALRGDPRKTSNSLDGYANAAELVAGLKAMNSDFDISVSAYPEKHPESPDFSTDIDQLKRKIDNGAMRAITQVFFDNDVYESYLERVRAAGIQIPIVPGIFPIHNFLQVKNFCSRNGTHIPARLAHIFEGLEHEESKTHGLVSATVAAEQVFDLMARGIKDFHFYTLNDADLTYTICDMIGIRPQKKRK